MPSAMPLPLEHCESSFISNGEVIKAHGSCPSDLFPCAGLLRYDRRVSDYDVGDCFVVVVA